MKVIDLLNKIANGEKLPNKIKVHNIEFHKCLLKTGIDYKIYSDDFYYLSNEICIAGFSLNDEVEILEEEKKIPEKIQKDDFEDINEEEPKLWIAIHKINEIIDYLKNKGE